jgi:hypothetical protein
MRDDSGKLWNHITLKTTDARPWKGNRGLRSLGVAALTVLLITSTSIGFIAVGSQEASAERAVGGASSGVVDLEVFAPDNTFTPGQADELTLQIANNARIDSGSLPDSSEFTTTARNVRVEIDNEDAPIEVNTGKKSIGSVGRQAPQSVPIAIEIPDDAEEGVYELDIELEYRATERLYDRGSYRGTQLDRSRSVTREIEIEIDDGPRFELYSNGTTAQIADSGSMTAAIKNVGGERAEDLTVELASTSERVTLGGSESESATVSALDPGEVTTIAYDVAFGEQATTRGYPLQGTVTYDDTTGITNTHDQMTLDVTPRAEQTFSIDDVESTLRVGENGDLIGTVTNTGPKIAESVVVQFTHQSPNVIPIEDEIAVGSLAPEESVPFRLPIDVTREAEAIPRSLDLAVKYRNKENELRTYEAVDAFAKIAEQRDQFLLEVTNREVTAGESELVEVEVTNNLNQPVTDVEARLFADDPLDSEDDESYIESIDPGESTTMTFELNAGGSAMTKTYPISFDFRYDDEQGNSQLSDTTRVAVTVTEAEGGTSWVPIVVVGLIVIVAGLLWYRRD